MYGLVNRAIEQLVVANGGEAAWQRVCHRAGVPEDGFVAMCPYDDALTFRLVAAVSEEMGMSQERVLEAFGEYWVLFTGEEGYGELMSAAGDCMYEFLHNLNDLHGRVEAVFPAMKLPRFRVEADDGGALLVHYESERLGLAPMVTGLLRGLAKRFGEEVTVQMLPTPPVAQGAVARFLVQPAVAGAEADAGR